MKKQFVGPMMKKISEEIERQVNEEIKDYNLTLTQAKVVGLLSECEDKMTTQKELEDFLQVSHPTTVIIVKSMVSKHMLETFLDEQDRRMKKVKLIWGNEEIYEKLADNADHIEDKLLNGFTEKEKESFLYFMKKAYQNVV